MRLHHVAVSAALLLALASCAAVKPDAPPSEAPKPSPTESASTPAVGALPEFSVTCKDPAGDGEGEGDLVAVDLSNDGSIVFVTFRLAESVQPTNFNRISFLVSAFSADGESGYQFGSKFSGGSEIANFVFDFDTSSQKNVTNGAVFADGQASMRYPVADLASLGPEFSFYAVIAVDGKDVDFCGGPLEDAIQVS